jgi:hypothetical protein
MADCSLLTALNLSFDPDGPALICTTCKYALAVSGSQVTSHLWNKHKICLESRRDVTPLIRSLQIPHPTDIALRPDESPVHPHLELYRGYTCITCKDRTVNLDLITRHVHSCCPLPRAATSSRRRNPDDLYQDVLLQTWGSGALRRYWIVHGRSQWDESALIQTAAKASESKQPRTSKPHSTRSTKFVSHTSCKDGIQPPVASPPANTREVQSYHSTS